jgi:hypothetical protein
MRYLTKSDLIEELRTLWETDQKFEDHSKREISYWIISTKDDFHQNFFFELSYLNNFII